MTNDQRDRNERVVNERCELQSIVKFSFRRETDCLNDEEDEEEEESSHLLFKELLSTLEP